MSDSEETSWPGEWYEVQINCGRKSFIKVRARSLQVVKDGVRELMRFQRGEEVQTWIKKTSVEPPAIPAPKKERDGSASEEERAIPVLKAKPTLKKSTEV